LSWGGLDCGEADAEPGFCGREWYWWRYRNFQGWEKGGNVELVHPAWERVNGTTIRFTYSQTGEQVTGKLGDQPRTAGSSGRCTWIRKPLPSGELLRAGAAAYGLPIPDEVEFPSEMPTAFFLEGNPGYFENGEWCQ
jgi:hypothetical protein